MPLSLPSSVKKWLGAKRKKKEDELTPFRERKLPIFWMTGPKGCGTKVLGEMLAMSSRYHLVVLPSLIKEEARKGSTVRGELLRKYESRKERVPDGLVVTLLKELILETYLDAVGYLIVGFPINSKQAKMFEKMICKVSLVIYVTLVLDALLGRVLRIQETVDVEKIRMQHIRQKRQLKKATSKYKNKTIVVQAHYPPEDTCTRLVVDLEDYWGYKFLRLYNTN